MLLYDKNETLSPPEGHHLETVDAEGAYLVLVYEKETPSGYNQVVIYLNDQGREVLRIVNTLQVDLPEAKPAKPMSRRSRFLNGLYLVLAGLQEMTKWVRNW